MPSRFLRYARLLVVFVGLCGAVVALRVPVAGQQAPAAAPAPVVPGEILVRFRNGASAVQEDAAMSTVASAVIRRFDQVRIHHARLRPGMSVATAAAVLMSDPDVLAVQPNYLRHIDAPAPPNDPFWLNDSLWGLAKIQAQAVWTGFTTGSPGIVVADIDTGVNYTHPDLAVNMWVNPGEVAGNGVDDDHNGYVDDVYGIDTVNNDSNPADDNGHGTHTAGTIAGAGNNGIGVVGVTWNTKVLACKFLNAQGSGPDSAAIECFNYITALRNRGVNVAITSNSWGEARDTTQPFPQVLKSAIDAAGNAGILNVFAAGNDNANTDVAPFDPASFTSPSIISVAASDNLDRRASFSNYGATTVDLAAPGVGILSTLSGSYGTLSGTSMATPHVSGAAALLLAEQPGLSNTSLKAALMNSVDVVSPWPGLVASGGRLNVYKASLSIAPNVPAASATFVSGDGSTQGSWKGVYGNEGYAIVGDTTSLPSYASITPVGHSTYIWTPSTTDSRALQRASSDRVMGAWYGNTFTLDVTITGSQARAFSIYSADFDGFGRQQRFDLLDASTGAVLDSRSLTAFTNGQWLTWSVLGHVVVQVTRLSGPNAVVSGVFLGGAAPVGTASGSAAFVKTDATTRGSWKSSYGADGFAIVSDTTSLPSYAQLAPSGHNTYTWAASTGDARALQRASSADRVMAAWYGGQFQIDLNVTGTQPRQVAVYSADFDPWGRQQRFDLVDGSTGTVLDSRTLTSFSGGQYLVWNVLGHVVVRVTSLAGPNAVVSGVFFGGPASSTGSGSAVFLKSDVTTQGAWKGLYGSQGYSIASDTTSLPAFASLGISGQNTYTWAASTGDVRALQRSGSGRVMAAWYGSAFTLDVTVTGAQPHQVAIYCDDFDPWGRVQRIDVVDAATGAVLDTRTVTSFASGQYLAWNVLGRVLIRVTQLAGPNAVVGGVFFD